VYRSTINHIVDLSHVYLSNCTHSSLYNIFRHRVEQGLIPYIADFLGRVKPTATRSPNYSTIGITNLVNKGSIQTLE